MLMAADRVEYRDLEDVLQKARSQVGRLRTVYERHCVPRDALTVRGLRSIFRDWCFWIWVRSSHGGILPVPFMIREAEPASCRLWCAAPS